MKSKRQTEKPAAPVRYMHKTREHFMQWWNNRKADKSAVAADATDQATKPEGKTKMSKKQDKTKPAKTAKQKKDAKREKKDKKDHPDVIAD